MNHKYIDNNTYEIIDNIFEVDEDIAEAISLLNKKGYKTMYCCSGHVKDPRIYEKWKLKKDEIINTPDTHIIYEDNDFKEVLRPWTFTSTYIMFDKDYEFKTLPKGFYLDSDNVIDRITEFYIDNIKKDSNIIQKEINEANNDLLEWVKSLPNLNK